MRVIRITAIPVVLAVALAGACKKESTGPSTSGTITCGAADASVCPPSNLALGFSGSAGTPTIAPTNSSTSLSASSSAFTITGTTSSTLPGYWFLIVGGTLRAWGQVAPSLGAFSADIPLFCGQQGLVLRFDNASGHSYWYATVTLGSCTVPLFRAQLTWDTNKNDTLNSDMDLHLVRPTGTGNTTGDCYFLDCQGGGLDWGAAGSAGDPYLDVDNTIGFGPENITIASGPETGTYKVFVYNYSGFAGTHPTVKLYFNDVEQARYTSAQAVDWPSNAYWYVASVDIVNKVITPKLTYSSGAPAAPGFRPVVMPRK